MDTHWKKLTNPDFLGSWDFAKGEERTLTINKVNQQEVFNPTTNKKDMCMVAHFRENSKPMILNKTNCKMITAIYDTPYIERWSGCKIIIGVDRVKAKGEMVDALRIRNQKPLTFMCNECKRPILAYGSYSAEHVATMNKNRYGVDLCAECSAKRKEVK